VKYRTLSIKSTFFVWWKDFRYCSTPTVKRTGQCFTARNTVKGHGIGIVCNGSLSVTFALKSWWMDGWMDRWMDGWMDGGQEVCLFYLSLIL